MKLPAFESLYEKRDELADLEANYFSNIQFSTSWIDTSVNGLKQDVNAARRKRCNDDHKWGFQKGFNAGVIERDKMWQSKVSKLLEALNFYTSEDNVFTEWDENSEASYMQERNKISCYEDFGFTAKSALAEFYGEGKND